MTNSNSTARSLYNSSNLTVECYWWGDIYKGKKEDLIVSKILNDGEFPSEGSNNKYSLRVFIHDNGMREIVNAKEKYIVKDEHLVWVKKSGSKFEVWVHCSREQEESRRLIEYMETKGFNQTIIDTAFTKFMYMVFSTDWYEDEVKFRKAANH